MSDFSKALDPNRLVSFTKELIRTPSLSRQEKEVSLLVAREMQALGYDEVISDELYNVVGIIKGAGGGKSLMLNGHIDHADPGQMEDPYSAREVDGAPFGHQGTVIYGRAASDMKAAVAAMVQAGGAIKQSGRKLAGDLLVTCVSREEIARGEGIKAVLAAGHKSDYAVSGEASGLRVYLGHRGKSEWFVTTKGKTTHGGNPAGGINAIMKMNRFLSAMEESYPLPNHQFLGQATWAAIKISSSPEPLAPIVPDRCQAVIDRRFLPEETRESLAAGLTAVAERLAGQDPEFQAEVELNKWFPALFTPPENPVVEAAFQAREKILGQRGEAGCWYFGVDGTFISEAGIPCVGFGPGNEYLAHTPKDVVPVDHLLPAARVYIEIAAKICA